MADNRLKCINCEEPIDQIRLYANMCVCETCYLIATRLEQRAIEQLAWLKTMYIEVLRVAISEHRLHLGERVPGQEPPKREVLEQIVKLAEKMNVSTGNRPRSVALHSAHQPSGQRGESAEVRNLGKRAGKRT